MITKYWVLDLLITIVKALFALRYSGIAQGDGGIGEEKLNGASQSAKFLIEAVF